MCLLAMGGVASVGCGPGDGVEGDGSGTSGSATGGDATGTTSADTGEPVSDTDDSTDGPPEDACAPIVPDEGDGQPLAITIRNDRAEAIFVGFGNECVLETFRIDGPGGDTLDTIGPICAQSCGEVIDTGCQVVDCGACGGPELIRLEPGASWAVEWSGVLRPGLEIPAACDPGGADCGTCSGRRLPEEGTHVVRAIAFATCTTDDALPCDECGGADSCSVYAGFDSDFSTPDHQAEASVDLPATTAVELVFGPT